MMKNTVLILFIIFCTSVFGQKSTYIKGNALLLPIGVLNVGVEQQLSDRYTLQADILASPWKSFAGAHAQIYMGHIEGRYYFDHAFSKWYLGANAGAGVFDVTKWNYRGSGKYQRGYTFMIGAVGGYQFSWKENWNIDVFLRLGDAQSFYHGYENVPPSLFRYDGAERWNKSGEVLPYGGGIMLSYKIH